MKLGVARRSCPPKSGVQRVAPYVTCSCGEEYSRGQWRSLLTYSRNDDCVESAMCRACGCNVSLHRALEEVLDDVDTALIEALKKLEECSKARKGLDRVDPIKHDDAMGAAKHLIATAAAEYRMKRTG